MHADLRSGLQCGEHLHRFIGIGIALRIGILRYAANVLDGGIAICIRSDSPRKN